jgi:hypothetical protein
MTAAPARTLCRPRYEHEPAVLDRCRRRGPGRPADAASPHALADQIEGAGWDQGTERETLRSLVSYWAEEFDWRASERELNAWPQFKADGLHFVHARGPGTLAHPDRVVGVHLSTFDWRPPLGRSLSAIERECVEARDRWGEREWAYDELQSTKPQSLGYGLNDSPAGWRAGFSRSGARGATATVT